MNTALVLSIVIFIIAIVIVLSMLSKIRTELHLSRVKSNDRITLDIRALAGLIRYRIHIPMVDLQSWSKGIIFHHKTDRNVLASSSNSGEVHLTKERILDYYERAKLALHNVFNLTGWFKETLARVECVHMAWNTRIGVGDAPETAMTAGLVWGIKSSMLSYVFTKICLKTKPFVQVTPQYNSQVFATELTTIMQIRLYHVVMAGIRLIPHLWKGKGDWETWQQILFKPRLKGTN